ncbi:hypothetical protein MFM001_21890 [Mycobacterium sp. MFM001]|uniref:hypothetical protein n=1 Tax=Mycobacterium sp. MFM001 TaxID=2049453 RepID=UPI000DA5840E|nr:hypothetical protein [Mycobacterium sp. MFM001]GBE65727.1 hypothetical protein MFM001_21890 [Mycobacterium sp. MFM001]
MQPVQINAGGWYLLPRDDADSYEWAVCEATTGEPQADVTLDPGTGEIAARARDGHDDAAAAATEAVQRFAAAIGVRSAPAQE